MKLSKVDLMEKIVALCKRRGLIFPGSEIYGGLSGTWDYGPLGTELKRNIKNEFWKATIQLREDVVGIDASIMMNPEVWRASGHVEAFTDPLVECKKCHKRFRMDLLYKVLEKVRRKTFQSMMVSISDEEAELLICPKGGTHQKADFTEPKKFNLLVKAYLGVVEGKQSEIFLRGEITQGVFVNFRNVVDSTRVKIPFGIAQIGKAFRNEITLENFTFRSREFEQMELEFFIKPDQTEGQKWFEYWKSQRMQWYVGLGIDKNKLRFRDHEVRERAHYAKAATDIEYDAPFGFSEFEGIHHRADWDLSRHKLTYQDESGEEFTPWVIETSGGVDRAALFFLIDAYSEENDRVLLKLSPKLAPIKVAVFPLLSNKANLVEKARGIFKDLKKDWMCSWDDRGNIGGRYASQDEIGTPYCITVDFDTIKDDTVTVRDRDTTKQERVKISVLKKYLVEKLS